MCFRVFLSSHMLRTSICCEWCVDCCGFQNWVTLLCTKFMYVLTVAAVFRVSVPAVFLPKISVTSDGFICSPSLHCDGEYNSKLIKVRIHWKNLSGIAQGWPVVPNSLEQSSCLRYQATLITFLVFLGKCTRRWGDAVQRAETLGLK